MKRGAIFKSVGGLRPQRNVFNLSYEKKFTGKMKKLYPVMCEEVVPGDKFKISADVVIRLTPLNAPVMDNVILKAHYFFVPYRLLWNRETCRSGHNGSEVVSDIHHMWYYQVGQSATVSLVNTGTWEQFLNGNPLDSNNGWAMTDYVLPRFIPFVDSDTNKGTLWDYFGFPTGLTGLTHAQNQNGAFQNTTLSSFFDYPLIFPWAAYNLVYNNFYMDETFGGNSLVNRSLNVNSVRDVAWEKDYFTSALPFQQRGIAPALPLYGDSAVYLDDDTYVGSHFLYADIQAGSGGTPHQFKLLDGSGNTDNIHSNGAFMNAATDVPLKADMSTVTSADISELRLSFQIQKWLERNARSGSGRYNEFLLAHFGIAPRDETLQRPAYIGGFKAPVMVSQVLTQNETQFTDSGVTTTTPTATQRGTGLGVTSNYVGTYTASEYGLILGVAYVTPKRSYSQGINRQWRRRTRYDFYFPEFAHLSEQGIESGELYWTGSGDPEALTDDCQIFGYQGIWDEMRFKPNMCCGELRPKDGLYKYWTFADSFNSRPSLGTSFIYSAPSVAPFAVQNEDTLIIDWGNRIKAYRPLPLTGEPGLIDHN